MTRALMTSNGEVIALMPPRMAQWVRALPAPLALALALSAAPLAGFRGGWLRYHERDYTGCGLFPDPIDF